MAASANWEFQTISIDFEVFKALTARLESPEDTYNNVLRDLLKLSKKTSPVSVPGKPWILDGVVLPHGTELRMFYRKQVFDGRIEEGAITVNRQRFQTPSAAAMAITGNNVNGWRYWECRRPGASGWTDIEALRSKN